MDRNTVRNTLLAQHERIRGDVAECRRLSQRFRAGEPVASELDLALAQLRADFDEHNRTETSLLLPLLLHTSQGRNTRGTLLAERMLEAVELRHAREGIAERQRGCDDRNRSTRSPKQIDARSPSSPACSSDRNAANAKASASPL
jgi:hypothetical protein